MSDDYAADNDSSSYYRTDDDLSSDDDNDRQPRVLHRHTSQDHPNGRRMGGGVSPSHVKRGRIVSATNIGAYVPI